MEDDPIIKYVSPADDAIDRKRSKLKGPDGYEGTLDRKHLVFLPGKTPVVFHLQKLDAFARQWVLDSTPGSYEQRKRVCEVGLVAVEGYAPWGTGKMWRGTGTVDLPIGKRPVLTREEVAEIEDTFGDGILAEFATILLHVVSRGKAWGRGKRPFKLPPSVWDDLADPALQPAE